MISNSTETCPSFFIETMFFEKIINETLSDGYQLCITLKKRELIMLLWNC